MIFTLVFLIVAVATFCFCVLKSMKNRKQFLIFLLNLVIMKYKTKKEMENAYTI